MFFAIDALIKAKSSSPVETGEDFSPLCLYEYHYKKILLNIHAQGNDKCSSICW